MKDDQIQREIEYSPASTEGLERFSEMFELCFGYRVGARYFNWKYLENPVGGLIAFEATHKGKPIALYGAIPEMYEINGEPTLVHQSMDTMTHPAYQRRGLFQKLAVMTYEHLLASNGGRLDIIGIPGPMSYPGFVNKLAWKNIHEFRRIFITRSLHLAWGARYRGPALAFKNVRELTPELTKFLEQRPKSTRPIRNALTPAFFDWRVFRNPLKRFEVYQIHDGDDLIGVLVYMIDAKRHVGLHMLEFVCDSLFDTHTPAVVTHLFAKAGASAIVTWEPMTDLMKAAYRRAGFIRNPLGRGPWSRTQPLIVRSESGKVGGVDWFDAANYDLQPIMQD